MKPDRNRPVSLEDLLRLKRAERPPSEFWSQFDRELRAKQLSALVAKRPWWQTVPAFAIQALYRLRLPLAATAICGLSFLALRENREPAGLKSVTAPADHVVRSAISTGEMPSPARVSAIASLADLPNHAVSVDSPAAEVSGNPTFEPAALVAAVIESPAADRMPVTTEPAVTESTGARLPVSLVTTTSVPSPGSRLLGGKSGFESRALPARATVEPLAQMTSPGESRRARLLTAMVSTASLETSVRSTERAASRIAEEHLYDQVQRFGARGDRLNVKF